MVLIYHEKIIGLLLAICRRVMPLRVFNVRVKKDELKQNALRRRNFFSLQKSSKNPVSNHLKTIRYDIHQLLRTTM